MVNTIITVRVVDAYVFRQTNNGLRFLILKRAETKIYEHLWQGVAGKIEKGEKARLIIGDIVFQYQNKFKYIYDLSSIWKLHTGLPFVFACWIANKKIDEDFQKEFNKALKFGVNNIEKAIDSAAKIYSHCENPADYLNNKISYILDADKKEGMALFLGKS